MERGHSPSRRDILRLFKPAANLIQELGASTPTSAPQAETLPPTPGIALNRRQAIQLFTAIGTLFAADRILGGAKPALAARPEEKIAQPVAQTKSPGAITNNQPPSPNQASAAETKKTSLAETGLEQLFMTAATNFGEYILDKIGLPIGGSAQNAAMIKETIRKPGGPFMAIVPGPIIEELLNRALPGFIASEILGLKKGSLWEIGIPTSLFFALGHNLEKDFFGKVHLNLERIPLMHFISGMYFWFLMRNRGIEHAMLAHIENNAIGVAYMKLFQDNSPPPSKPFRRSSTPSKSPAPYRDYRESPDFPPLRRR